MENHAELELPIKKTKIDGPFVRSLDARKEDNNGKRACVKQFEGTYEFVKPALIESMRALASMHSVR